jgi:hypothetical protein
MLHPYYHDLQERRHRARQTTLLSYFKNRSKEPPNDPKTAEELHNLYFSLGIIRMVK